MNDSAERRFYGKYRAVVSSTEDPDKLGRVQVTMNDFPALKGSWCMPCVPYAGKNLGWFVIPEVGASIWIEFEGGDLRRPIWTGCFWPDKDSIPADATPSRKTWKTPTYELIVDDLDGKAGTLEMKSTTRQDDTLSIKFDADGISIKAKDAHVILKMDESIVIDYPSSKIELTKQQTKLSLGESSSITITSNDQTLKTGSLTLQAASELSVSAGSSASVSSGRYSLSASTITLSGSMINIG